MLDPAELNLRIQSLKAQKVGALHQQMSLGLTIYLKVENSIALPFSEVVALPEQHLLRLLNWRVPKIVQFQYFVGVPRRINSCATAAKEQRLSLSTGAKLRGLIPSIW
jgi:hypothetical protein